MLATDHHGDQKRFSMGQLWSCCGYCLVVLVYSKSVHVLVHFVFMVSKANECIMEEQVVRPDFFFPSGLQGLSACQLELRY